MTALYRNRLLVSYGTFFFRYRNFAFPLVVIPIIFIVTPVYPGELPIADRWLDILMLTVGLVGEALRVLVVGYAYIKRGGVNKRIHADTLVTGGMFAHSRNALYLGNILMLASVIMFADNLWGYVIGGPFFLFVYISMVAAEEDFLKRKFGGEFEKYCSRVNRWIPNFSGFRQSVACMRFNWKRVIAKEYSSVFVWILAVLAIEARETSELRQLADESAYMVFLAVVLIVASLSFVLARWYKKSG